jgi:hypothetical protein
MSPYFQGRIQIMSVSKVLRKMFKHNKDELIGEKFPVW